MRVQLLRRTVLGLLCPIGIAIVVGLGAASDSASSDGASSDGHAIEGTARDGVAAIESDGAVTHLVRPGQVKPVPGPDAWFTGSAVITPVFSATEETPNGCAYVAFEPGARSAWHTHPAGQLLVVTEGNGWIQQWGEAKREIVAGDVIWTPPGVKHWHGATATAAMTHVAIQQAAGGDVVEWMETVSDEQYLGPRGE